MTRANAIELQSNFDLVIGRNADRAMAAALTEIESSARADRLDFLKVILAQLL